MNSSRALLAVLFFTSPALAQTDFDGAKHGFVWSGDCGTVIVFKNTSGIDLCDLWIAIDDDNQNNNSELSLISISDASGAATWDVDDDEDGDNDDDFENTQSDGTPFGSPTGWHRAQARDNGDCIAPGATFTVRICGVNGETMVDTAIYMWGTTHSSVHADSGGDHGVRIASKPKKLSSLAPGGDVHLANSNEPPAAPMFSMALTNDDPWMPMQRVRVVPGDPDFDVVQVQDDAGSSWGWSEHVLTLQNPIQAGETRQIWLTVDHSSQVGASSDIRLLRMGDPPQSYCTAKQNSQGCSPILQANACPSVSSPQPCYVLCQLAINQKSGLLFYGYAPYAGPFQGGTLCVNTPLRRTPIQSSGGSPPPDNCTGSFAYDFNARIDAATDPNLVVGAEIFAQYWYRDPASQSTTGLSNGLHFVIDL